jgi:glycosyltransferase involved in cell wall biosynthesis
MTFGFFRQFSATSVIVSSIATNSTQARQLADIMPRNSSARSDLLATNPDEDSPRLAICLVTDAAALERIPNGVRHLLIGLVEAAIDAIVICPNDAVHPSWVGLPIEIIDYRSFGWPLEGLMNRRLVTTVEAKVDSMRRVETLVVHGLAPKRLELAGLLAKTLDAPLVATADSWSRATIGAIASALPKPAAAIAPSLAIARQLSEVGISEVTAIPHGVVAPSSHATVLSRQRAPTIVFAGPVTRSAGLDLLLRAVKHVMAQHPTLSTFIIGRGSAESDLRHLAQTLGIAESITFTGSLEKLTAAFEAADVFCLPGADSPYGEELPLAMASGLAVIAAAESPYDDLIDEKNVLLLTDEDEEKFAERLLRLLDNPDLARGLAATASQWAKEKYSAAKMVESHIDLYRKLTHRDTTLTLPATR